MKLRNVISISAIVMLVGIFLAADAGYAAKVSYKLEGQRPTVEGDKEIGNEVTKRKGSVYAGGAWLIEQGFYGSNAIEVSEFKDKSGINPATGKPYSQSTIDNEVNSLTKVELAEKKDGRVSMSPEINRDIFDAINKEVGETVQPLKRQEAGKDTPLALNRFNLTDLNEADLEAVRQIVEKHKLSNNQAIKLVAFQASFVEQNPDVTLEIISRLRNDQQPVIIVEPGQKLNIDNMLLNDKINNQQIPLVEVKPGSVAAQQFADMFKNQKFVGLKSDIDGLKTAIEKNETPS